MEILAFQAFDGPAEQRICATVRKMLHAAAGILVVLGALHSILGEILVFRRFGRVTGFEPLGFPPIAGASMSSPVPTLRATWHTCTLLAVALAAIVWRMSPADTFAIRVTAASLAGCALLWIVLTRGKHVGWIGFLSASILTWLGAS